MKTYKQAKALSATEQAVVDYLASIGVGYSVQSAGEGLNRDGWGCDGWRVTFHNAQNAEQFEYYTGTGLRVCTDPRGVNPDKLSLRCIGYEQWCKRYVKPHAPHAAGVLYGLLLDAMSADQGFSNWCADLGFDSDSIKAFNMYRACEDTAKRLRRVFTREQMEHIQELLQDY